MSNMAAASGTCRKISYKLKLGNLFCDIEVSYCVIYEPIPDHLHDWFFILLPTSMVQKVYVLPLKMLRNIEII